MYDIIVIGAGPGGYIAAERAGALGKRVLLLEKSELGGVCLNAGCIPTKTLLHASKLYAHASNGEGYGVKAQNVSFDIKTAMAWKRKVIETNRKGIAYQMKRFGVEVLRGEAKFLGPGTVSVDGAEKRAQHVIIATGSSPARPPIPGIENPKVVTSTELLSIDSLPGSITVIGGGYIGMEFASFFSNLGVRVTVVEMMDEIIPFMEPEFAAQLRKSMKGVEFMLGTKVVSADGGTLTCEKNGVRETVTSDLILLSTGRVPNVKGMGFEEAGLDLDRRGIKVDERMKTNLPGVFAIGDVTGLSLLAHSASRMGEVAVNTIAGKPDRMRLHAVPWAVYTMPEVAGCGLTEADAVKAGRRIKVRSMQLRANARFLAEHGAEAGGGERGMIKVVTDSETDVILGVQMLGSGCSELAFGAALMIEAELRAGDVKDTVFPHPTVSEVLRDVLWE